MVESVVNHGKYSIDMLSGYKDGVITFRLKDQVVIIGLSYILSGELFFRKTRINKNNFTPTYIFIIQLTQINSIVKIVIHHWYLIWILVLNKVLCGLS